VLWRSSTAPSPRELLVCATAMASTSTISSGKARRLTPISVVAGRHPASWSRLMWVGAACRY
jgi:hypothetical protein